MNFTDWLHAILDQRNLSNSELARRMDVSRTRITQVLNGDTPGASFCVKLAAALGLPTTTVLRRAGFPVIQAPPVLDDDWEARAWAMVQQVPEQYREGLLIQIRALVE